MVKETKMTAEQEAEMVAVRDEGRVTDADVTKAVDYETASHLWQAGSAAVNSNVNLGGAKGNESVLDKIDTPENLKAKIDAAELAAKAVEEMNGYYTDDCSKLDVSDPRYCQPGSDRHKAFLKAK